MKAKIRYIMFKLVDVLSYGLSGLENNNNKVNFYQFKHCRTITRSRWKKVASKEITLEGFIQESSAREKRILILTSLGFNPS